MPHRIPTMFRNLTPSTTAGLARHVRREATRSDVQAWIEGLKGLFARIALRLRRAELMACPSEKVITAHSASIPAVVLGHRHCPWGACPVPRLCALSSYS